jgi:NADH dehydrogenase
LYTQLAKNEHVRVALIDENNYHQFQPLLYQLATEEPRTGDRLNFIRQSLRNHFSVDVKMLEVTVADPKTRTVSTRDGESYRGFLVEFFGTAGTNENTFPLYSLRGAQRLHSRMLGCFRGRGPRP